MNRFSYYIITHFIPSNKYYNSYRNSYSVYQTYPKLFINFIITKRKRKNKKKRTISCYQPYHVLLLHVKYK